MRASIEGPHSGERDARTCSFLCRPAGDGVFGLRSGSTRAAYTALPGSTPPAGKSGKPASSALDTGAIGNGPRVTIVGRAAEGQTLPSNVTPAPISDRPGYGTAIVNGHRSIIDLSNNRIVQVMD